MRASRPPLEWAIRLSFSAPVSLLKDGVDAPGEDGGVGLHAAPAVLQAVEDRRAPLLQGAGDPAPVDRPFQIPKAGPVDQNDGVSGGAAGIGHDSPSFRALLRFSRAARWRPGSHRRCPGRGRMRWSNGGPRRARCPAGTRRRRNLRLCAAQKQRSLPEKETLLQVVANRRFFVKGLDGSGMRLSTCSLTGRENKSILIMVIGWRNPSEIRWISLPNDMLGSECFLESFARCSLSWELEQSMRKEKGGNDP